MKDESSGLKQVKKKFNWAEGSRRVLVIIIIGIFGSLTIMSLFAVIGSVFEFDGGAIVGFSIFTGISACLAYNASFISDKIVQGVVWVITGFQS